MKLFSILTVCVAAAAAAPNAGSGWGASPEIRLVSSSYDLPETKIVKSSYDLPEAKIFKSSYDLPEAKIFKSSYDLPEVKLLKKEIPILKYFLDGDNYGTYRLETLTGDGSSRHEEGHLKDLGDPEGPVVVMSGSYSFVGDDGKTYTVTYTADENGFQASGDHLPTPPPIPEEIRKSLSEAKASSSSYDMPAPQIRVLKSYDAPLIRTSSYSAPAPSTVLIRSSGY